MGIHGPPKDEVGANRSKYNRRRENLRHALEQFLLLSEARQNPISGKVYQRELIEKLHVMSEELLREFPEKKEKELDFSHDVFLERMDEAVEETKRIIEEGKKYLAPQYIEKQMALIEKMKKDIKETDSK